MEPDTVIEEIAAEKMGQIRDLELVDANIWLGSQEIFPNAPELSAQELRLLLPQYHITGALLSHWDAVRLSAQDGNQALLEAGEDLPENVYTVWTGLPTKPREQDPLPGLDRPDPKIRGVRLFPQTHKYQLAPWVVGELCEWCSRYNLPLFLWHVEIQWQDVYSLAQAFPNLTIVIETQWQKILYHIRVLFNLLRSCSNVLVESSNLIGQDYLSNLVNNFGAERLLFGSFLPVNDPLAAIGMILDADIDIEAKRQIAGSNLRRLLAEVRI